MRGVAHLPKSQVASTLCRVLKLWSPYDLYLPRLLQPLQLTCVKPTHRDKCFPQTPARPPFHTCFSRSRSFLCYLGHKKTKNNNNNKKNDINSFQGTGDQGQLFLLCPVHAERTIRVGCGLGLGGWAGLKSPEGHAGPGSVPVPTEGARAQPSAAGANVCHQQNAQQTSHQQRDGASLAQMTKPRASGHSSIKPP